jgi:hypothetical protein
MGKRKGTKVNKQAGKIVVTDVAEDLAPEGKNTITKLNLFRKVILIQTIYRWRNLA